jgi:6-phosphofructokinase 1
MAAVKGNAVVGQSGGPTAVINQSLVGVIQAVRAAKSGAIQKLWGAQNGVRGITEKRFIDLRKPSASLLEAIAQTPAAALGSTRDKPDAAYCDRIFKVFQENNVRYFFYIGGNDSADTARIVNELAAGAGYELHTFHIPKTIDNDLKVTDHCPGYGSAARFVISALMGDDRDNASLPGVKIDIIMGRHAGWLTAATSLARRDETEGPHLVYVPESRLSLDQFADDVAKVYGKLGRCVVAMSEGVEDENGLAWGEKIAQSGERDAHGNIQLSGSGALGDWFANVVKNQVAQKLGGKKLRVRADTLGYMQRSFAGYASPVDQKEARAVGKKAVQLALSGQRDGSVAIVRKPGKTYGVTYTRAELKDVARETKPLPPQYINKVGNGITESFRSYLLPLVGKLPVIGKF